MTELDRIAGSLIWTIPGFLGGGDGCSLGLDAAPVAGGGILAILFVASNAA